MELITFQFQMFTLLFCIIHLLFYFEQRVPKVIIRALKFGRSGVGLESNPITEVPKRWFTHFYVFAFGFSTWTLFAYWRYQTFLQNIFAKLLNSPPCIPNSTALLVSLMMWVQVSRRLYECLFITKFSQVAKMNILAYIIGILHYFGAIVSVFGHGGNACSDCSILQIVIAVPIFVFAWLKQLEAHTILANLRKGSSKDAENEYKIPFGDLFEYVSCPNYFCEVIIYIVYSSLFGFQNTTMNWVTVWVVLNQVFSANLAHNWYHTKFGDTYPKQRKALIPYLF